MTEQEAKAIHEEAVVRLSYNDFSIDDRYSGRGMYGQTTYAITCDYLCDFDEAAMNAVGKTSENYRKDSMGLGVIIY